ncbi:histidine--tRNA ligase, partial [bacterium]
LEALNALPAETPPEVFVVAATRDAENAVRDAVRDLRRAGIVALSDLEVRSLKSQLRQADSSGARTAILIGADELAAGTVTVRDLTASEQRTTTLSEYLATYPQGR